MELVTKEICKGRIVIAIEHEQKIWPVLCFGSWFAYEEFVQHQYDFIIRRYKAAMISKSVRDFVESLPVIDAL